jgi:hypothetical protein
MTVTEKTKDVLINIHTGEVAALYAKERNVPVAAAMRYFMATKTYALLLDKDSFLYMESAAYIYDMLKDEIKGDWKRWMEI